MKLQGALLLVTLLAMGHAGAQSQTNATASASATITVQKPKLHWLPPVTMTNSTENLKPVEGLDPRAWTTVVGWYPGESAFATGETHRSKLVLFWVDVEPEPIAR
jgi:hypothetical protein